MTQAPKVVIPVEFDSTEARKQLAEFCGQRFVISFNGSRSSTEFVMTQPPFRDLLIEDQLRPNYHEDTRLVDIVAQFGYMEYSRGFELGSTPKPDDWTELTDIIKNSWRRAAREQLKEMNV